MANADNAIGFVPIKHKTGGEIRLTEYSIASAYNTALGKGDPVQLTGTGTNIAKAEATNVDNIGVFAGCRYIDTLGNPVYSEYWPASTATKGSVDAVALVWDDPLIVFRAQMDTCASANIGTLSDWDSGTPSSTTRLSGAELVAGSATTGASMRILGLSDIPDNAYGTYAKVDVMFAEHVLLTGAAGAGGV
ncbi:MAG: hypothetical protein WAU86_07305 [Oricola sp.]